MGRAVVAPADRVPVPCSITVPLKRLKHFDCKDKQALLVGGFGRLCERLVRGQGPLRSPGHRGRVGRGVPASTSGCLRPAAPRRGRQGRVPGGGSSRSSRRPFPGCPEGRRGPGPRDGGHCPPWPHAARARAPGRPPAAPCSAPRPPWAATYPNAALGLRRCRSSQLRNAGPGPAGPPPAPSQGPGGTPPSRSCSPRTVASLRVAGVVGATSRPAGVVTGSGVFRPVCPA